MNEDRRIEFDGRVPEFIELNLAEICPLDIGGDHETRGAELLHGVFGLAGGGSRVR